MRLQPNPSNTQTTSEITQSNPPKVARALCKALRHPNDFHYTCTQPRAETKRLPLHSLALGISIYTGNPVGLQ